MDRIIEKEKGLKKKHLPYLVGGALLLTIILWLAFGNHESRLKVDTRVVSVEEVKRGEFNDYVRINGQVTPKTIVQLSPLESGIVQQKIVEEGSVVKKGDVILRLSNNQLNLEILNSEASLAEKENFLRNTRVTMEQEKLSLRREMSQIMLDLKRKKRNMEQNEKLIKENLIAKEDYIKSKEDYDLAQENYALVKERQKQDSVFRELQVVNLENSLNSMRKNMALTYERLENLNVKSPIDGQLGALDVVLGQSVGYGLKIGQINDLSDYKIEANIDEHYIDRVKPTLEGSFERQGTTFNIAVNKVYPDVKGGQFKTDIYFIGQRPDNIRSGQTYYINLQLGQPTDATIIPRGAFYQATGGTWIYVVAPDGKSAHKRIIKIGRQNPSYYEVLEGLEPGEKVIVSSYDTYGDNETLVLK